MTDGMMIPSGLTCGDCQKYPKCKAIIASINRNNTECDFFPVKFVPSPIMFAAYKADISAIRADLDRERDELARCQELYADAETRADAAEAEARDLRIENAHLLESLKYMEHNEAHNDLA